MKTLFQAALLFLVALSPSDGINAVPRMHQVPRKDERDLESANCGASDVEEALLEEVRDPLATPNVLAYYYYGDELPINIDCAQSQEQCPYYIYQIKNDTAVGAPIASEEPEVKYQPCVRCEFDYLGLREPVCSDKPCDIYSCLPDDQEGTVVPEEVQVCEKKIRVDYFAVNEFRDVFYPYYRYGCSSITVLKEYVSKWTEGVTNVKTTEEVYGDEISKENDQLDVCTYKVDGVECKSCDLCEDGFTNLDTYEADCSNIEDSAVTSCADPFSSMNFVLLRLQEGFIHPETEPPTPKPAPIIPNPDPLKPGDSGISPNGVSMLLGLTGALYIVWLW